MFDRTFLDWPFLDQQHRVLYDAVDSWAEEKLSPILEGMGETTSLVASAVKTIVRSLGENGVLESAVGYRKDGGYGPLDGRSICIVREVLARHSGLADFAFAMQGLGSGAISLFGSEEQKAAFLPRVRSGELLTAFGLSEAEAGSDVASISTAAQKRGDSWVINGEKAWISNAGIADLYVIFARTGEGPGSKGISAFIVPAETEGLSVTEVVEITSPHPIGTILLRDCEVPAASLIGEAGRGFATAMAVLDVFRPTVGAAALGFARAALDASLDHATRRTLFGQPLSALQITQERIADTALAIDAAALLVYRAAWIKDRHGLRTSREASMAKLFATEMAQHAIDATVQLFGGRGVVRGSLPERLYRDIRPLRIYEGASEVQKIIIASQVLGEHQAKREPRAQR